ncbi:hypothetical protein D8674_006374 [Pyrus ussuriensis x Pyrus communis]|uniref:Uncharacterized protein n=1 Tax=Pyrus ussuriensis x Pyrus communis TaxID=2448454 RepID=A0A5N5FUV0_9ROSA|nr:hypothetical protein D8674_006374 [Pyrus ussuriensis x Pyrus communis]
MAGSIVFKIRAMASVPHRTKRVFVWCIGHRAAVGWIPDVELVSHVTPCEGPREEKCWGIGSRIRHMTK